MPQKQEVKALKTITIPGQKTLQKALPPAKGYAQNSFTGIGFGKGVKALDSRFLNGFFQKLGFTIPIIKIRADSIDFANFVLHNKGLNFSKKEGYIAVAADKGVDILMNKDSFTIPTDVNSFVDELEVFE